MISPVTASLIGSFKEPILKLFSNMKSEVSYLLDDGLPDYVENQKAKFELTKTFLYRNEKIPFYDIYFPVTIRGGGKRFIEISNINNLFEGNNFLTLIGVAGSGKSMLLKHIFLSSINELFKIPILLELRNLNEFNGSITDYIYQNIFKNKLAPNQNIIERILEEGYFIFLFDGYDEIFSKNKQKITSDIEEFIDIYSKNYYLITSRPGSNIENLQRFNNYYIEALSNTQITDFIHKQIKDTEDPFLANKIIDVINKPENFDYYAYLNNPLLLSMFILTFNSYPELPKSKNKFYWNVFDTLCTKHDSFTKKGGFLHERKTKLQNEDFEAILKWFSYKSLFTGKFTFDEQYLVTNLNLIKNKLNFECTCSDLVNDLTVAISIIIIDGLEYKFPHKSLQEYFAAQLIKNLEFEIKKEIYSNKLVNFELFSLGSNYNLFNLLIEIDKSDFYEYFIIYHLKKYLNSIDKTNDESKVRSILTARNFCQGFTLKNNDTIHTSRFSSQVIISESIMSFFHCRFLSKFSFSNSILNKENKDYALLIFNKYDIPKNVDANKNEINYEIRYSSIWNEEIYKLLINLGLKDAIINSFNDVEKMILKLETELNKDKENCMMLLDI